MEMNEYDNHSAALTDLEHSTLKKEVSLRSPHIARFQLHEMYKRGKFIFSKVRLVVT
jgi:hypothetical protein